MMETEKDIVIIGAGLTGLALAYYLKKAGKNVLLLEQSHRTGGVIDSVTEKGFTYEKGPSTGVLGSLEIIELFDELKAKCVLETASKTSANKRYIWKKSRWVALPSGLVSGVTTPLFTLYDKFRILGEPFRKKGGYPDESIAEMVVRRLGKSFLDYAVDPFLSGVYAGDPYKLITRHALPKLYALEFNHGGFIRGTIAKHKGVKAQSHTNAHKITREVFSVQGGLINLTEALTNEIGYDRILLGCTETKITPVSQGFSITYTDALGMKKELLSHKVVTTIGGYALNELLPFADSHFIENISNTTYAPVIQVAAGYNKWTGVMLDAFGGLISSKDKRRILGVLFPSAIFAGRAPQGGAMLSVFMGGMKNKEMLQLSDSEIEAIVKQELRLTMKTTNNPDLLRIHRYQHAIAQYDIKSEKRFESIAALEQNYPGLILAGSFRDGIGMSDRVKQAKMIADKLINE